MDCISNQVVFFFCSGSISTNKVKIAFFQKSTFRVPVHQSSSSIFNVHPSHLISELNFQITKVGVLKGCEAGEKTSSPRGFFFKEKVLEIKLRELRSRFAMEKS